MNLRAFPVIKADWQNIREAKDLLAPKWDFLLDIIRGLTENQKGITFLLVFKCYLTMESSLMPSIVLHMEYWKVFWFESQIFESCISSVILDQRLHLPEPQLPRLYYWIIIIHTLRACEVPIKWPILVLLWRRLVMNLVASSGSAHPGRSCIEVLLGLLHLSRVIC